MRKLAALLVLPLILTSYAQAQTPEPPVLLEGTPLVAFESSFGHGGGNGDGGNDPATGALVHTCSAKWEAVPASSPVGVSKLQGPLIVFSHRSGNCTAHTPKGCKFWGSLRFNNNSARDIEVCPPGTPLGATSCKTVPPGGWYRFSGLNVVVTCTITKNTKKMLFGYFENGTNKKGSVTFTCEPCN